VFLAKTERKSLEILEGEVEQIDWHRKKEAESLRRYILELQGKLGLLESGDI
jgi:hypothetical protein